MLAFVLNLSVNIFNPVAPTTSTIYRTAVIIPAFCTSKPLSVKNNTRNANKLYLAPEAKKYEALAGISFVDILNAINFILLSLNKEITY